MNCWVNIYKIIKRKYLDNHFIDTHSHQYFHFVYVLSGNGRIVINGVDFLVSSDCFLVIPEKTPHSIYSDKNFKTIDIKGQLSEQIKYDIALLGSCIQVLKSSESAVIEEILHEGIGMGTCYSQLINASFMKLLYCIIRRYSKEDALTTKTNVYSYELKNSKWVNIESYINTHIHEYISTEELAKIMGYNETYFCTLFKHQVGISPQRYIQINKIERAKHFMVAKDYNITQIADMLGFKSIHYFSRFFKSYIGCSPNEYLCRFKQDMGINILKNECIPQPTNDNFYVQILKKC